MDAADDDARTFKADCTAAGEELLRGRVREKLRELRSNPDETLLDYLMVMLKNGKRKQEARKELHVFLGDDTEVFISWLWEHLSLHLHLYVQAQEQNQEIKDAEAPKEVPGRKKSSDVLPRSKDQTHSEHTVESSTDNRRRNKREWKGIGREGTEGLFGCRYFSSEFRIGIGTTEFSCLDDLGIDERNCTPIPKGIHRTAEPPPAMPS